MVKSTHDGAIVQRNDRGPDLSTANAINQRRCMQLMVESALEDARAMQWTFLVHLLGLALNELCRPTDFQNWSDVLEAEIQARKVVEPLHSNG